MPIFPCFSFSLLFILHESIYMGFCQIYVYLVTYWISAQSPPPPPLPQYILFVVLCNVAFTSLSLLYYIIIYIYAHFDIVDFNFPLKIKPRVFDSKYYYCFSFIMEYNETKQNRIWFNSDEKFVYVLDALCVANIIFIRKCARIVLFPHFYSFTVLLFLFCTILSFFWPFCLTHKTVRRNEGLERLSVSNKTLKHIISTCYLLEWSTWNRWVKLSG